MIFLAITFSYSDNIVLLYSNFKIVYLEICQYDTNYHCSIITIIILTSAYI